jgi:hypothetical protein
MSHKKIANKCADEMKKDEKHYEKKIATAKKQHDIKTAKHYGIEKNEAKKGEKVIRKLEKSFKTD